MPFSPPSTYSHETKDVRCGSDFYQRQPSVRAITGKDEEFCFHSHRLNNTEAHERTMSVTPFSEVGI